MQCIVCERPAATIAPVTTRDAKAVHCSTCGDYEFSGTAEAALAHRNSYFRLQALRFAQTNAEPGRKPFIHG